MTMEEIRNILSMHMYMLQYPFTPESRLKISQEEETGTVILRNVWNIQMTN